MIIATTKEKAIIAPIPVKSIAGREIVSETIPPKLKLIILNPGIASVTKYIVTALETHLKRLKVIKGRKQCQERNVVLKPEEEEKNYWEWPRATLGQKAGPIL